MSIIHNARAIVLTCTLLAAPGLVAASLPVARAAQNTPPSTGRNVSALPTPARPPEPAAAAPTNSRGPVIGVAETTQDGGTVEEGTVLHFQFKVANQGGADLEINEVRPSCGCTVPHWDKLILPGKNGVIEAEVHTEHFRGPIQKHLTVISNNAAQPQLDLILTANVTPLVQIDPGPTAALTVDDKPATQEFTLERTGGQPMKILQVTTTQPYVKTAAPHSRMSAAGKPGVYDVLATCSSMRRAAAA